MEQKKTIGERGWLRIRPLVLNAFILLNLGATLLWLLPPRMVGDKILRPVARYVYFVGIWQRWAFFAPEPSHYNTNIRGIIEYSDKTKTTWDFPRLGEINPISALSKTRFREWGINLTQSNAISPDFAPWFLAWHGEPDKKPWIVSMMMRLREIPAPTNSDYQPPLPLGYDNEYQLYRLYKTIEATRGAKELRK